MAWTAPRTWVTAELVTASIMNTHVRDNLLTTAPALVTTAGDTLVATGANALKRLGIGSAKDYLRVNAAGNDLEWSDLKRCQIYHNTTQSAASGSGTKLTFNSEYYDPDGMHDPGSNPERITIPAAGLYLVSIQVGFAADSTGYRGLYVQLNGDPFGPAWAGSGGLLIRENKNAVGSSQQTYLSGMTVYEFDANDYIEVFVEQDSGNPLNILFIEYFSPIFAVQQILA